MTGKTSAGIGRRESSLAVQSVILTSARAVGFALTFAIPLILVRIFSQSEFGVYKQVFLIAATLTPIFDLGLIASIFYFVPRDGGDGRQFVLQALGLLSLGGAAGGLMILLGGEALATLMGTPAIAQYRMLVALFVALSVPAVLVESLPVVDQRPTIAAYTITGGDLFRAGAIIFAALFWRTIGAVVWAAIASAALRGLWLLLYIRLRASGPGGPVNARDLGAQLRYSLPFAIAGALEIGLGHFHQYYVAIHSETARFAIYSVGILHIPVLGMLVSSVVDVMLVRAAEAHGSGDRAALRRLWRLVLERLALVLVPCWLVVQVFAPDIIGLLFGREYHEAVPVFRIFTTSLLLWGVVDHGILRATGDTPFLVKANVVGLAASIAVVFALAPFSLFLGGIAGYVVGMAVMRGLGVLKVAKRLDLGPSSIAPWRAFGRIAAAAMLSALASATTLALPGPLLRLAAGGTLFAATYAFIAYRWELVPRSEVSALLRRFVPAFLWSS